MSTGTEQLSLWGDEQPDLPRGCCVIPEMGGIVEVERWWADGDTSPAQLERLARVLQGDLQTQRSTYGVNGPRGPLIWYRIIKTRVEGEKVIATLQRIEPVLKGYDDWVRERRERGEKVEDEKDEEY